MARKMRRIFWISLGMAVGAILTAHAAILPGPQIGPMPIYPLDRGGAPKRIVSMAPGITETLFAIGAGGLVCGVTDFCDFPDAAKKLPKVGGYYDPNFEAIVSLRPDLVILLPEHAEYRLRFQHLHITTMTVEMNSLAGMMNAFYQLGMVCRHEAEGLWLLETMRRAMIQVGGQPAPEKIPSVMLVISRDYKESEIQEVYIAGRGEFYDQLILLAGGENAYVKPVPRYPKLSREGILALKPDLIVDCVAEPEKLRRPAETLAGDWRRLPGFEDPRRTRVAVLTGTYLVRPGPRMLQLLETLARLFREVQP